MHYLKHIFREGANCQKLKLQINENFEKMSENKQSNLIANLKTPNMGFINKYIINSGIWGGGGAIRCWLITSHFSQISFH